MKIDNIIKEWDPYSLFPFAPQDEYNAEINQIKSFIKKEKDIDNLAKYLESIFDVDFIYDENKKNFLEIAKELV